MSLNSLPADDSVNIRAENIDSITERRAIRSVNEAAFGGTEEADLVDELRREKQTILSLVTECEPGIVGYVLFSRMWIKTPRELVPAVALAPVAVLPEFQRRQIGERLIRHGLTVLRTQGERIVIVVGHPDYYPRFGFSTAKAALLEGPFPREVFMAMELSAGALDGVQGPVVYPPAFGI